MYLDFFKLKELPFRLTADPRFHFVGDSRHAVLAELRHGLTDGAGCLILAGDVGVGKTILATHLLQDVASSNVLIQIRNPEISVGEFYQAMLASLDERPAPSARSALQASFDTCLAREAAMRRTVVLFLDNGELASTELLDEILRLPRRSGDGARNLKVLLVARSSIHEKLEQLRAGGRSTRFGVHVSLKPFNDTETRHYVQHRLDLAAARSTQIVDDDAFAEIRRFTGGVPRLINMLADASLMLAFNRNRERVDAADVRGAAEKLQWVEFNVREALSPVHHEPAHPADAPLEEPQFGHLRIELGSAAIVEFDLPVGRLTLGRAKNNDVRIDSQYISRHHCRILTTEQYSVIEDLQSQNGIIVGARRVSVHRLQDGDTVTIGEHRLIFTRSARSESASPPSFPITVYGTASETDVLRTRLMIKAASVDLRDHP